MSRAIKYVSMTSPHESSQDKGEKRSPTLTPRNRGAQVINNAPSTGLKSSSMSRMNSAKSVRTGPSVLIVSTPSRRKTLRAHMSAGDSGMDSISIPRKRYLSPLSATMKRSPTKTTGRADASSGIPQPADPKSALKVKAQRNPDLTLSMSKKKENKEWEDELSPSKSNLGKPQRLFIQPTSRPTDGLLCLNSDKKSSRDSPARRLSPVRRSPSSRLPNVVVRPKEINPVGLKSPARRLGSSTSTNGNHDKCEPKTSTVVCGNGSPTRCSTNSAKELRGVSLRPLFLPPPDKTLTGNDDDIIDRHKILDHESEEDEDESPRLVEDKLLSPLKQIPYKVAFASKENFMVPRNDSQLFQNKMATKIPTRTMYHLPIASTPSQKLILKRSVKPQTRFKSADRFQKNNLKPFSEVIAYLDIRTQEGDDASFTFATKLSNLGAKVVKQCTRSVTHVIFKHGSPKTLYRSQEINARCLNLSWVVECEKQGRRVPEESFLVDIPNVPKYMSPRRQRSFEPKDIELNSPLLLAMSDRTKEKLQVKQDGAKEIRQKKLDIEGIKLLPPPQAILKNGMDSLKITDYVEQKTILTLSRRNSHSHVPLVSSPLANRSWSAQDLIRHSDDEDEDEDNDNSE
ncbi:hypothetical protein V1511DRAFT_501238 [Dipodascopsis uninucleata]